MIKKAKILFMANRFSHLHIVILFFDAFVENFLPELEKLQRIQFAIN